MTQLLQWSQGTPGALMFLMKILELENIMMSFTIVRKLEEAKTIRGTNLYVLWSDLCEKDMSKVEQLCKTCPTNVLEDACSRQDYSGRKLVAEYLV